jgi:hypothetical protein
VANFSVASRKTWALTSGQEDIVTLTAAGSVTTLAPPAAVASTISFAAAV